MLKIVLAKLIRAQVIADGFVLLEMGSMDHDIRGSALDGQIAAVQAWPGGEGNIRSRVAHTTYGDSLA